MTENASIKRRFSIISIIFALLWTAAYVLVYQLEPFSEYVNLFLLNFIQVVAGLTCAVILTIVTGYYKPGEPPRRVWLMFAIGIWSWTIADVAWSAYNMIIGEVPAVSAADIFWTIGYVFFTASFISQFQLILFDRSRRFFWMGAGIWVGVVFVTLLIMWLVKMGTLGDFFAFFYPVADFAVGVAAIILTISFRRGNLARPWMGLFVFVVADSLYLWATLTGSFDWVSRSGLLTLLSELIYVIAYLFLGWGAFGQYLDLRYGATVSERDTKPSKPPRLTTKAAP
jgi:hypothetical protein